MSIPSDLATAPLTLREAERHPEHGRRTRRKLIAIAGGPNCGKSTLFNKLTGLRQKVANYPGVTVEKKAGFVPLPSGRPCTGSTNDRKGASAPLVSQSRAGSHGHAGGNEGPAEMKEGVAWRQPS